MKLNNFFEDLEYSSQMSDEEFWGKIYAMAFPDMVCQMKHDGKSQSQQLGIDRIIHLRSGKTIYIDEKKRRKEYPDILIEYVHVGNNGDEWMGWIEKDLIIDYLAYAFMPSRKVLLYDWQMLRLAWEQNKQRWLQDFKPVLAENQNYITYSLPVPFAVLHKAVSAARIICLH